MAKPKKTNDSDKQNQEFWDKQGTIQYGPDQMARMFQKDRLVQRVRKTDHDSKVAAEELAKMTLDAEKKKREDDLDRHLRNQSPGNMRDR